MALMSSACTRTRSDGAREPGATTGRTAPTRTVGRRLSVGTHAGYLTVPSLAPRFETEGATKAILASSLTACSSTGFTPPGTAHVHAMLGGFVNVRFVSLLTRQSSSVLRAKSGAILRLGEECTVEFVTITIIRIIRIISPRGVLVHQDRDRDRARLLKIISLPHHQQ